MRFDSKILLTNLKYTDYFNIFFSAIVFYENIQKY